MENRDLELRIQKSVKNLLSYPLVLAQSSPSINIAPGVLRELSPSSFNPLVVSIGPLHKEAENVQTFEKTKPKYLNNLMDRIKYSTQEEILNSCMKEAYSSMKEIRASYVCGKTYHDDEIAEMMVMDSCVILEFMLQSQDYGNLSYSGFLLQHYYVLHDMLLLENQIPIFFVDKIFQCTISEFRPNISLVELIHPVLFAHNLFVVRIKTFNISINSTDHILGLLHKCCTPKDSNTVNTEPASRIPAHSAVNLYRAGVNIRPNQNPTWPMQLEVKKNWFPCFYGWSMLSLRMPVLEVNDTTEFMLRNLIAYEQSLQTTKTQSYVTSFALALDMLMNTPEDVAMLVDSGVLINHMGSNEEATNMINNICKHLTWEEFIYEEQWKKLDNFCNSYWPKQIAKMRSTYFSSPWSMVSLIAGIMLFALSVIQTIFTVNPPK